MSQRPIMDAGPGINFLSLNQERLLFDTLGALSVPEVVRDEILRKATQDQRFSAAERVWRKLPHRLMEVLSDDVTDDLAHAVHRICGVPMARRQRQPRDLGEIMVVAHAAVAAESGQNVVVLMDDSEGRRIVAAEQQRLTRLHSEDQMVGRIHLISTHTVLKKAAGGKYLPDRNSMRQLYEKLRGLDDGLVPLQSTELLDLPCWSK